MVKGRIHELEEMLKETFKTEMPREKERRKETEHHIHNLWDNNKCINLHVRGLPEGKKSKEQKKIFGTFMAMNFTKLIWQISIVDLLGHIFTTCLTFE